MPEVADDADAPVDYIARTHAYYRALGFATPYRYARFDAAPFAPLSLALSASRIAIVTTASPHGRATPLAARNGEEPPYDAAAKFYRVYSADSENPPTLTIAHVAYDRANVPPDDPNVWFPLAALRRAASAGRIGALAPRFHAVPTNRSQRTTLEVDSPEILRRCREDEADAVILVPNCPVCHQVVSLVARVLEAGGIPTVVMGCAKDIVESAAAPRFLFSDFPLGAACGRPHDRDSQDETLALALGLLDEAKAAPTTRRSPLTWSNDRGWKRDYCRVDHLTEAEIERRRAAFDGQKDTAHRLREAARG